MSSETESIFQRMKLTGPAVGLEDDDDEKQRRRGPS